MKRIFTIGLLVAVFAALTGCVWNSFKNPVAEWPVWVLTAALWVPAYILTDWYDKELFRKLGTISEERFEIEATMTLLFKIIVWLITLWAITAAWLFWFLIK